MAGIQLKNPANLDTQLGSQRGYEDAQTFKSALHVSKLAELEPARDSEPAGAGSCVRYIKRITKKMSNMTANMAASTRWRLLMLNLETAAFPSFSDTRIEYNQGTDNIILVSGVLFQ
jgi:roadblock/LC7 domain-containing protein